MLLTVDIGNSHIVFGGYVEDRLTFTARIVSQVNRTEDQYAVEVNQIMLLYGVTISSIKGIIMSSVVPELSGPFKNALYKLTDVYPLVVGPGVKTGLNILIDNPAQLGADLVAGAVAAIASYPLPCLIYDLGTAITISVIDKNANYIGCIICAGTSITLDALTTRTALLPHMSLERPTSIIGKNSVHSMQSGLIYGTAAMLDGIAARVEQELGSPATLLATGGMADQIVTNCMRSFTICDNLLLDGLRLIFEKNKKLI